jgi:prepilin-type N-terminal cleavage/methylation domain-containing protein
MAHMSASFLQLRAEDGFTLPELLTVIAILGVILAISAPAYTGLQDRSAQGAARSAVRAANQSVEAYYQDNGTFDGISADVLQSDYDESLHPYSTTLAYSDAIAVTSVSSGDSYNLCSKSGKWWAYKDGPAKNVVFDDTNPPTSASLLSDDPDLATFVCPIP